MHGCSYVKEIRTLHWSLTYRFVSYELLPFVIGYVMALHSWKLTLHGWTARMKNVFLQIYKCTYSLFVLWQYDWHTYLLTIQIVNISLCWICRLQYMIFVLASLAKHTTSMPIFGNRHRGKACLLTNTRMIHTHMLTINMILM